MTTNSKQATRISYNGNGSTVLFSVPFRFVQNSDIVVYKVSSTNVVTILTPISYTGSGVANGGSLTLSTAPTTGERVVIVRKTDNTQSLDLISGSIIPSDSLELILDKLALAIDDIERQHSFSVKRAETSSATASLDFPDPVIGKGLMFKSDGSITTSDDNLNGITTAANLSATAAETAKTAAETSQTNAATSATSAAISESLAQIYSIAAGVSESLAQIYTTSAGVSESLALVYRTQAQVEKFTWRSNWASTTAYIFADIVYHSGSTYRCKLAHTNQTPPNTTYWDVVASKGGDGLNGTDGTDGINGTNGVDGTSIIWRNIWSSTTSYGVNDAVQHSGSSYICTQANTNELPTNIAYWSLIAQQGANGYGTGTVTAVATGTGLVGGPITNSGTIAVDAGTNAGQVVQVGVGGKIDSSLIDAGTGANKFIKTDATSKISSRVLSTGISTGDIVVVGTGNKIANALIDTGLNANQIVQRDANGDYPIGNGSAITNIASANLSGALPAIDGSALTGIGSTGSGAVDIIARDLALRNYLTLDTAIAGAIASNGYFTDTTDRGTSSGTGTINYQTLTAATNSSIVAGNGSLSVVNNGITTTNAVDTYFGKGGTYLGYDLGNAAIISSVRLSVWDGPNTFTVFGGNTSLGHATDATSLGDYVFTGASSTGHLMSITNTNGFRYIWLGPSQGIVRSNTGPVTYHLSEFEVVANIQSSGSYTSTTQTISPTQNLLYIWARLANASQWGNALTVQGSRDNGANFVNATEYKNLGNNIVRCKVDLSTQTGTQLKYKVIWTTASSGYTWLGGTID